jgi:hypothetical protein
MSCVPYTRFPAFSPTDFYFLLSAFVPVRHSFSEGGSALRPSPLAPCPWSTVYGLWSTVYGLSSRFGFRPSAFGFLSDFGLRPSDFPLSPLPLFCMSPGKRALNQAREPWRAWERLSFSLYYSRIVVPNRASNSESHEHSTPSKSGSPGIHNGCAYRLSFRRSVGASFSRNANRRHATRHGSAGKGNTLQTGNGAVVGDASGPIPGHGV